MDVAMLGLWFGLAAGVSPGPLLALVVATTLRDGVRHGVAVACAPLISDALAVTVALLTLGALPHEVLTTLGVVGGLLVVVLGVATVVEARSAALPGDDAPAPPPPAQALFRAGIVNILSPHPWIAWATVLGPLTVRAWQDAPAYGVGFVALFYLGIVGTKALLAVLIARGRHLLGERGYRVALATSGVLLVLLGILLVVEFAPWR